MVINIKRELEIMQVNSKKKTRHEGDEGTVAFWLWMKAIYKDEE